MVHSAGWHIMTFVLIQTCYGPVMETPWPLLMLDSRTMGYWPSSMAFTVVLEDDNTNSRWPLENELWYSFVRFRTLPCFDYPRIHTIPRITQTNFLVLHIQICWIDQWTQISEASTLSHRSYRTVVITEESNLLANRLPSTLLILEWTTQSATHWSGVTHHDGTPSGH